MPDIDPFAGAYDAGAAPGSGAAPSGRLQVQVPMGRPIDPFANAVDAGPDALPSIDVTPGEAAKEGYLDTAGFGFRDEVKAASEASGLPSWLGGFRAPIGGTRLLMEQARGERGEATKTYERELAKARELQRTAKEQHPGEYLAGQVGGALVGPGFGAGTGATVGARAVRSGLAGGLQGGLYGFGSGEGSEDRLKEAAIGGGIGAIGGTLLSPVADIAAAGLGKGGQLGRKVFDTIRAEFNPNSIEDLAAKKVLTAHLLDRENRAGQPALTSEEHQIAQQAGVPMAVADVGGERTRALARSAADVSPEARGELGELAQERYAGQSRRIGGFIKDMTGGDVGATQDTLQAAARRANRPAYAKAYGLGNREIAVSNDLMQSPAVQAAMREAMTSGKNRAAAEGMAALNPNQRNLQFWDYTYRNVRDAASAANRAGRNEEASALGGIANRLRDELDQQVPEFQQAREGAARFFGARDALEAGKNFVDMKGNNSEMARQVAKMSAPERQLFAQGFAAHLADRILELRDSENVIGKAFLDSPNAKQRIRIALGAQNADRLEALLRVEAQIDKLRQAMGNSRTNQYQLGNVLTKAGAVAGGGVEAYEAAKEAFGEGGFDPEKLSTGHLLGSALLFGSIYGKGRMEAVNEEVARRVGQMLASEDPAVLRRGIDMVAKNRSLREAVRNLGQGVREVVGRGGRRFGVRFPATQGPNVPNYPPEEVKQ